MLLQILYNFLLSKIKRKEISMTSLATSTTTKEEKKSKSKFNDEFDNYLKRQCLKTTFNGLEIETFSWYKKVLGLL